jgi:hypothetical protein
MDITKMLSDPMYAAYNYAAQVFGKENAALAERIYILETGHYKSTQFLNGYSAGMVAFADTYPYGWSTLQAYWDSHPLLAPTGTWTTTVAGKPWTYITFARFLDALFALCIRLQQDGWDANKWNGDTTGAYGKLVASLTNVYVV